MLAKTLGIVLNYIKYKESSIIVRIYTAVFGFRTYIVNGVRCKQPRNMHIAFFQPLMLLDLVVYEKKNKAINRIAEAKIHVPFIHIFTNYRKMCLLVFLAEVLYKVLKESQDANPVCFDFIMQSLVTFDTLTNHFDNFHILFLLKLLKHIGWGISTAKELFPNYIDEQDTRLSQSIDRLLNAAYGSVIVLSPKMREKLLAHLLAFYRYHLDNFNEIRSLHSISC